jgi:hypothetical protein
MDSSEMSPPKEMRQARVQQAPAKQHALARAMPSKSHNKTRLTIKQKIA